MKYKIGDILLRHNTFSGEKDCLEVITLEKFLYSFKNIHTGVLLRELIDNVDKEEYIYFYKLLTDEDKLRLL